MGLDSLCENIRQDTDNQNKFKALQGQLDQMNTVLDSVCAQIQRMKKNFNKLAEEYAPRIVTLETDTRTEARKTYIAIDNLNGR